MPKNFTWNHHNETAVESIYWSLLEWTVVFSAWAFSLLWIFRKVFPSLRIQKLCGMRHRREASTEALQLESTETCCMKACCALVTCKSNIQHTDVTGHNTIFYRTRKAPAEIKWYFTYFIPELERSLAFNYCHNGHEITIWACLKQLLRAITVLFTIIGF